MTRAVVVVFAACVATSSGGSQQTTPRPVFGTATDAISLEVSVTRRQQPVVGLGAGDFVVSDNGVPQVVSLQPADTVPADVTVVFDWSRSAQLIVGRNFVSDLRRMAAALRPTDRLRVITFAEEARELVPLQSPAQLTAATVASLTPTEALSARVANRRGRPGEHVPATASALHGALFDAVLLAVVKPPDPGRRQLALVLTEGLDFGGFIMDGSILRQVAERTDTLLHFAIWDRRVNGTVMNGSPADYARAMFSAAANATGGDLHDVRDAVGACTSILAGFRRSFLTYTLTGIAPAGWHAIDVTVPKFPAYEIRARKGYLGR